MTAPSEAQSLRDAVAKKLYEIEFPDLGPIWTWEKAIDLERAEYLARAAALLAPTGPIGAHIAKIEADHACQIATLTARIADLEAALEPFAKIGGQMGRTPEKRVVSVSYLGVEADGLNSRARSEAKVSDFRAARSALSNKESGHE